MQGDIRSPLTTISGNSNNTRYRNKVLDATSKPHFVRFHTEQSTQMVENVKVMRRITRNLRFPSQMASNAELWRVLCCWYQILVTVGSSDLPGSSFSGSVPTPSSLTPISFVGPVVSGSSSIDSISSSTVVSSRLLDSFGGPWDYTPDGWITVSRNKFDGCLERSVSCRTNNRVADNLKLNYSILKETCFVNEHYNDVIMSAMSSQITSLMIVYSTVYSRRRPKKTSKLRVRWPLNPPHKGPVTRKMFPFDDVIMNNIHRSPFHGMA